MVAPAPQPRRGEGRAHRERRPASVGGGHPHVREPRAHAEQPAAGRHETAELGAVAGQQRGGVVDARERLRIAPGEGEGAHPVERRQLAQHRVGAERAHDGHRHPAGLRLPVGRCPVARPAVDAAGCGRVARGCRTAPASARTPDRGAR